MRHDTERAITEALVDGSLTIREISVKAGISYNTVRTALTKLGAISDDFHPAGWTISEAAIQEFKKSDKLPGMLSVKMKDDDEGILVSYAETPVYKWNRSVERLSSALELIVITPETDRADAAAQLKQLAGHLASLSYRLTETADDPAWFTTLGAVEPEEEKAS